MSHDYNAGESLEDLPVDDPDYVPGAERYGGAEGYVVKDSGTRTEYASGMVRDGSKAGKINYTRIFDGVMSKRYAEHLTRAEPKYPDVEIGVPNWTLADSREEQEDYRVSAIRHMIQWLAGETDEDHAAAVWFNMDGFETVKAKLDVPIPTGYFGPWMAPKSGWDLSRLTIQPYGSNDQNSDASQDETSNDAYSSVQPRSAHGPYSSVAAQPSSEEGDG